MKIELFLNPNCSEAVLRFLTLTDLFSTGFIDLEMLDILVKEVLKIKEKYNINKKRMHRQKIYIIKDVGGGFDYPAFAKLVYAAIEQAYSPKKLTEKGLDRIIRGKNYPSAKYAKMEWKLNL